MKKILLLALAIPAFSLSFGQALSSREDNPGNTIQAGAVTAASQLYRSGLNKGAGLTDTLYLASDSQFNGSTRALYADFAAPLDSGLFFGTSALGYKAAAQLYYSDFDISNNNDTTTQFIGFFSKWAGRVQSTSTKTVSLCAWNRGTTKIAAKNRTKFYVYGTPGTSPFITRLVNANALNLTGTLNFTYLTAPVTVTSDVYVGYSQTYNFASLAGDTLAPRTTLGGYPNYYSIESGTNDTLISARTLIQDGSNNWQSVFYNLGVTNGGDLIIGPVIKLSCPKCGLGVGGFHRGDLSFYGNYPNPAFSFTNVKFSLAKMVKVTCTLYDNTGRQLRVTDLGVLGIGEHVTPVSVEALSSGNYTYVLETSDGDIIAAQMSVVK